MIDQSKLTDKWVQQVAGEHNADPLLIEKVIRALLLLEGLVKQDLTFVFKGGTALMLHFDSTKRLSIDIDIILPNKEINLEEILTAVVEEQNRSEERRVGKERRRRRAREQQTQTKRKQ